ncbi:MAG: AhpC/TSA family protein [Alloprevotella sp.]|nr:AhpC/TSA family protein [Alloprevotella sp.]
MTHLFRPFLLIAALALTALTACMGDADRVRISGKYENLRDAQLMIYCESGVFRDIDTLSLRKGKFDYQTSVAEPQLYAILYPNSLLTTFVVEPGEDVRIKGNANRLAEVDVSGSKTNERLSDFRRSLVGKPLGDRRLAAEQYIRDHAGTLDGLAVFIDYFAYSADADPKTSLSLLNALRKGGLSVGYLDRYESSLRPLLSASKGCTLPEFTATDLDGKTVRSADLRNKPTLVVVWSSWTKSVHDWMRTIRTNPFVKQGSLRVLHVSIDGDKQKVRQIVRTDTIPGQVVCDEGMFASPIASKLCVTQLPSVILVDKDGRIVERDMDRKALEKAIEKLVR